MLSVDVDFEPTTISEALSGTRSSESKSAIKKELDAFKANNAWELVDKPSNRNNCQKQVGFQNQKEPKW